MFDPHQKKRLHKDTYTKSFIAYIDNLIQSEIYNLQNKHNCTLKWNPYYSPKAKDDVLIFIELKDKNSCKDITTSNIPSLLYHFIFALIYGRTSSSCSHNIFLKRAPCVTAYNSIW